MTADLQKLNIVLATFHDKFTELGDVELATFATAGALEMTIEELDVLFHRALIELEAGSST